MTRALAAFLFLVTACASAFAQGSLLQGGPWVAGRSPMYVGQGSGQAIVQDSGPAGGGATGVGLAEQLLVARGTGTPPYVAQGSGPFGTNWCDYDAPTTNPTGYHFLCLGPNSSGGGLIAYGAGGGAAALPLQININGTLYQLPVGIPVTSGQMFAAIAQSLTNGVGGFFNWTPADLGNAFNISYNHGADATSLGTALLAYMQTASNATPPGLGLNPISANTAYQALLALAATLPR